MHIYIVYMYVYTYIESCKSDGGWRFAWFAELLLSCYLSLFVDTFIIYCYL